MSKITRSVKQQTDNYSPEDDPTQRRRGRGRRQKDKENSRTAAKQENEKDDQQRVVRLLRVPLGLKRRALGGLRLKRPKIVPRQVLELSETPIP